MRRWLNDWLDTWALRRVAAMDRRQREIDYRASMRAEFGRRVR